MVLPTWSVVVVVDDVSPNVGGTLDTDLRMRPWVANMDHFALRPGDWAVAEATVAHEAELVRQADHASSSDAEFEDALAEFEGEHFDADWSGLDLGVAGLVLALNAAGFATASSCRQHVGGQPFGDGPFVFLTGDVARIGLLVPLAVASGVGLEPGPPGEGFTVYAATIAELMTLAALILTEREEFQALPETIGWDQDAYEDELD